MPAVVANACSICVIALALKKEESIDTSLLPIDPDMSCSSGVGGRSMWLGAWWRWSGLVGAGRGGTGREWLPQVEEVYCGE